MLNIYILYLFKSSRFDLEVYKLSPQKYAFCFSVKVLEDVTGEEFVLFMKILSGLKSLQTVSGRQQLVELVAEQADLEQTFNPSDTDCVDRLLQCTRQAVPLFSVRICLLCMRTIEEYKYKDTLCYSLLFSNVRCYSELRQDSHIILHEFGYFKSSDRQLQSLRACSWVVSNLLTQLLLWTSSEFRLPARRSVS